MTTVPLNDLQRIYITHADELSRAVQEVLCSGWWLNGPANKTFCAAFAEYLNVRHCIGVANGTDALEIALRVLLKQDGRFRSGEAPHAQNSGAPEVITVANAGGYASTACYLVGCVPVYADIDASSQLVSIPSVVAALTEHTLAVVATHLYGGLVDVPALRRAMDAAGYKHVPILEDCAQAHGLTGNGAKAGSFGNIATFSFYPTKNLGGAGDGGAVVTNDDQLAEDVRRLQQYGWGEKYRIVSPGGRNSRLDDLQAAILAALLPSLDAGNARRQAVLAAYERAAPEGVHVVRSPHGAIAHLAVVLSENRDHLRAHLTARSITTDIHYPVLDCDQEGWRGFTGRIGPTGLDVARSSVRKILTLPCFPALTEEEVAAVCDALSTYISR